MTVDTRTTDPGTLQNHVFSEVVRERALVHVPAEPARSRKAVAFLPAALLVPGLAIARALLEERRRSRRRAGLLRWAAAGVGVVALAGLARWQLARLFTPSAAYEVEKQIGPLEIRRYSSRVQAETLVSDTRWDDALGEGFRRLGGYIFGRNGAREKVPMVAPVLATKTATKDATLITFEMPSDRALASLPVPDDDRIVLRDVPGRRVAALVYRGRYRAETAEKRSAELVRLVREAGLTPLGEPSFAGYDSPATLPLLRRVEAVVAIA